VKYQVPQTVDEAVAALAGGGSGGGARILAGGTDFYPSLKDRPNAAETIDITRVAGLRGISREGTGWRIGATTTWTDILRAPLPRCFDGLKAAAREVGSVQIQNAGTVAGNLCNASPAADGVPPLLALGAEVDIASPGGVRRLPLDAFLTGVRMTALQRGELVTAVHVPEHPAAARSAFLKLGSRAYLVISTAMVAVVVTPDEAGRVAAARVAVGACSPVACRLPALEAALLGKAMTGPDMAAQARAAHLSPLSPISDVRGTSSYRNDAVLELIRRALAAVVSGEAE